MMLSYLRFLKNLTGNTAGILFQFNVLLISLVRFESVFIHHVLNNNQIRGTQWFYPIDTQIILFVFYYWIGNEKIDILFRSTDDFISSRSLVHIIIAAMYLMNRDTAINAFRKRGSENIHSETFVRLILVSTLWIHQSSHMMTTCRNERPVNIRLQLFIFII